MEKYYCEVSFTRGEFFCVEANSEKEAKEKLKKFAAKKKKPDEEITGEYIHKVYIYNKQECDK